jgi:hypothetical protein
MYYDTISTLVCQQDFAISRKFFSHSRTGFDRVTNNKSPAPEAGTGQAI